MSRPNQEVSCSHFADLVVATAVPGWATRSSVICRGPICGEQDLTSEIIVGIDF